MESTAKMTHAPHTRSRVETKAGLQGWPGKILICICFLILVISGCKAKAHYVSLRWDPPTTSPVPIVGYNVYRATTEDISSYRRLNSSVVRETSYMDSLIQSGRTYIYVVKSVGANGNESVPSNVFKVTIP